jgi:hypothetical protein
MLHKPDYRQLAVVIIEGTEILSPAEGFFFQLSHQIHVQELQRPAGLMLTGREGWPMLFAHSASSAHFTGGSGQIPRRGVSSLNDILHTLHTMETQMTQPTMPQLLLVLSSSEQGMCLHRPIPKHIETTGVPCKGHRLASPVQHDSMLSNLNFVAIWVHSAH